MDWTHIIREMIMALALNTDHITGQGKVRWLEHLISLLWTDSGSHWGPYTVTSDH